MSWRLRTEVDLSTGETIRFFIYSEEEEVVILVPEGPALELVRELMKTYPDAIQAIANDLSEGYVEQPPDEPPPQETYQPLYAEEEEEVQPVPQVPLIKGRIRRPEQEDVEDTPLRIPSQQVTLQSLAPKSEREAPQG